MSPTPIIFKVLDEINIFHAKFGRLPEILIVGENIYEAIAQFSHVPSKSFSDSQGRHFFQGAMVVIDPDYPDRITLTLANPKDAITLYAQERPEENLHPTADRTLQVDVVEVSEVAEHQPRLGEGS